MPQVTELLDASRRGDTAAIDRLFNLLYEDMRQLAAARLRRSGNLTLLDTTALVHESYLKFLKSGDLRAEDRRAFFAYASSVMR